MCPRGGGGGSFGVGFGAGGSGAVQGQAVDTTRDRPARPPAVELIETDVAGDLTYYKLNVNTDAIVTFAQNNQDIQSAGNAGNFGDVSRMMIGEITAHPDSYLGKGDPVSIHDELVYDGSGFNVTPDGYIVTNTHVAVVSKSDAIQGFVADLGRGHNRTDESVDRRADQHQLRGSPAGDP